MTAPRLPCRPECLPEVVLVAGLLRGGARISR
jgi:hypothetical protein